MAKTPRARGAQITRAEGARAEKSAQRLAREIVRHIYDAGLKAGDKYYSETEAIEHHGVSRGTLREALRYLQIQGVIEIRPGPGGGHFVAAPHWENLASTLALLLQFAGASTSSLIEARGVIEPGMAELAASNAEPSDIANIDAALAEMEASIDDYDRFYDAYSTFWNHLATATKNPLFGFLSPALRRITRAAGVIPNENERADATHQARMIRDAVAAHDPDLARERMTILEKKYEEVLHTNYPRQMARTISWANFSGG